MEIRRQRRERNRWIIIATVFFAIVFATATLVHLKRKDPDGKRFIDFDGLKRFFYGGREGGANIKAQTQDQAAAQVPPQQEEQAAA